ncbi:hypothetical protein EVAR_77957_1, partial [Eumeta japonica]
PSVQYHNPISRITLGRSGSHIRRLTGILRSLRAPARARPSIYCAHHAHRSFMSLRSSLLLWETDPASCNDNRSVEDATAPPPCTVQDNCQEESLRFVWRRRSGGRGRI